MIDRKTHLLFLKAFGGYEEGGPKGQLQALTDLRALAAETFGEVYNVFRVQEAKLTEHKRLPRDHRQWATHMSHCYGLDDDPPPGSSSNIRMSCKYGQDDICPAALYEDPWAEYLEWRKADDAKLVDSAKKSTKPV